MLLWSVLACSPSIAEREAAARAAPTLDEALRLCPSAECGEAAVVRFAAWDRCHEVTDPWDDECRFRHAEALEREDKGAEALAECATTVYAGGCSVHVVQQQARRPETLAEAESRLRTLSHNPRDAGSYWRAFFRAAIARGDAPALEQCPTELCRQSGAAEIEATVDSLAVPCRALDRPPPGWIPEGSSASLTAWTSALRHHCIPDPDHPVPEPAPSSAPRR